MTAIEVGDDLAQLDRALEAVPNNPAVFLLWPKEGEPYLSKTGLLRRRLLRLLKDRERPSRLLNLRHTARRIEYRLTGSPFESAQVLYEQARRHFPATYLDLIKLRMPPYVKIVLGNQFPRSHITTHLTRTAGGVQRRAVGRLPDERVRIDRATAGERQLGDFAHLAGAVDEFQLRLAGRRRLAALPSEPVLGAQCPLDRFKALGRVRVLGHEHAWIVLQACWVAVVERLQACTGSGTLVSAAAGRSSSTVATAPSRQISAPTPKASW